MAGFTLRSLAGRQALRLVPVILLLTGAAGSAAAPASQGTDEVVEGAKKIGKGVEEAAKGIGKTVSEGAKDVGHRAAEAGKETKPAAKQVGKSAKGFGEAVWEGLKSVGHSVRRFFTGS